MKTDYSKIAFYGKGGIGKSTLSANIAALLAGMGKNVLFIGCDPKSDSTRTLMKKRIPTVMRQLDASTTPLGLSDILFTGVNGVRCIEAGGPRVGTGCAGMGISAALKEIERLDIFNLDWDLVIFDVLGDVVCGGFSIPMRKDYVDRVYIVSSSEQMSMYAANNIMQGVQYYVAGEGALLGGLIHNHVGTDADRRIMAAFAQKTGVPVIADIDESEAIRTADIRGAVITEQAGSAANNESMDKLRALAHKVLKDKSTVRPCPLSEDVWDDFSTALSAFRR